MGKLKECVILIDTREQSPLSFPSTLITTRVETVDVGDYAVEVDGVVAPVRIERKSKADLFSSFSGDNYRREKEKIEKARVLGIKYIIAIEDSCSDIRLGCEYWKKGRMHKVQKDGLTQVRQMMTISQKYNVEVHYFAGKHDMAFWVQERLYTYARI